MPIFTKDSLSLLREKIDLIEVLSPYVHFSRSGGYFKACCPFHEEKTPSFVVQRGDSHYHCYGCGAHGDAIEFLMHLQKMTFIEAVEYLAEKFGVQLEKSEGEDKQDYRKKSLKEALHKASIFYHFFLLHTKEGEKALSYLYKRGIDLDFIRMFQLGYAPTNPSLFQKTMEEQGIKREDLIDAGLIQRSGRDFFSDRLMIPICDIFGAVIGFSARACIKQYSGPKYVNTPETLLFKKSKILFGLHESRRHIAKERKAIIVEGQIDAMRLIYNGFSITVAGQGTAIGEEHVRELVHLGVREVYLAMDSDRAGKDAAIKVGDLFLRHAVEVFIVPLPQNSDPDLILLEMGIAGWKHFMEKSVDYITFLVQELSKQYNLKSPAQKNQFIKTILERIKSWEHPLLVHESIKKVAELTQTPHSMLGIHDQLAPNLFIETMQASKDAIDADLVLETDLLRWLYLMGEVEEEIVLLAKENVLADHFIHDECRHLFSLYMKAFEENQPRDLLALTIALEKENEQEFLSQMLEQKKINREKASLLFKETVKKILDRQWMRKREKIRQKIQRGDCSHEEALSLAKTFDELKRERPIIKEPKLSKG